MSNNKPLFTIFTSLDFTSEEGREFTDLKERNDIPLTEYSSPAVSSFLSKEMTLKDTYVIGVVYKSSNNVIIGSENYYKKLDYEVGMGGTFNASVDKNAADTIIREIFEELNIDITLDQLSENITALYKCDANDTTDFLYIYPGEKIKMEDIYLPPKKNQQYKKQDKNQDDKSKKAHCFIYGSFEVIIKLIYNMIEVSSYKPIHENIIGYAAVPLVNGIYNKSSCNLIQLYPPNEQNILPNESEQKTNVYIPPNKQNILPNESEQKTNVYIPPHKRK